MNGEIVCRLNYAKKDCNAKYLFKGLSNNECLKLTFSLVTELRTQAFYFKTANAPSIVRIFLIAK